ncbi:MAG: hypothetical protein R3B51_04590 [Thermodesulfobacteriota bacterium]
MVQSRPLGIYGRGGWVETPSLPDLISTTFVGVPIGVVLEESSDWLVSTDFVPAKILGHVLNPMRNFVHDRQIGVYNPLSKTFMSLSGLHRLRACKRHCHRPRVSDVPRRPDAHRKIRLDLEIVNLKGRSRR